MRKALNLLRDMLSNRSPPGGPPSPPTWLVLHSFDPRTVLGNFVVIGLGVFSYHWVNVRGRNMYENWKGEKKLLELQQKLDRQKNEPTEAVLEMVQREIEDLKPKLSKRKVRSCKVENYEREVELLKSKVFAWEADKSLQASKQS